MDSGGFEGCDLLLISATSPGVGEVNAHHLREYYSHLAFLLSRVIGHVASFRDQHLHSKRRFENEIL